PAGPRARGQAADTRRRHLRARSGELVPLQSLVPLSTSFGSNGISRYNLCPAAAVNGQAAPGSSTGQALMAMEALTQQTLPDGFGFEWTGLALQERQAGAQ